MTKPKQKIKKLNSKAHPRFHIEFKNSAQRQAWEAFKTHDILFLEGCAGTGKSFLTTAFAISEILSGNKKKIILTRPIVEAGESLGYLPGDLNEKVGPYMVPLYDCITKLVGDKNPQRDLINLSIEVAPLAFMRGRTFDDSICIFDEAQNASLMQLKLFMTRLGENSKMIINGDPSQSDLTGYSGVAMMEAIKRLEKVSGVGVLKFGSESIVRHPLVSKVVEKMSDI